jgi:hypothetical protein
LGATEISRSTTTGGALASGSRASAFDPASIGAAGNSADPRTARDGRTLGAASCDALRDPRRCPPHHPASAVARGPRPAGARPVARRQRQIRPDQ